RRRDHTAGRGRAAVPGDLLRAQAEAAARATPSHVRGVAMTPGAQVLREDALAGMSAIVTGAGSGIGRAIALRLVQLGAAVTGLGRHEETLAETGACAAQVAKGR